MGGGGGLVNRWRKSGLSGIRLSQQDSPEIAEKAETRCAELSLLRMLR